MAIRVFKDDGFSAKWPRALMSSKVRQFLEFDLFHIMVFPTPFCDFLILLALMCGKKVVLTDVGGGGACLSTRLAKYSQILTPMYHVHGLAHLTEYASIPFAHWRCRQVVLRGGVSSETEKTKSAGIMGGYALFVGRLLPHKGVLELISCLSPETSLHVVGTILDHSYHEKLVNAARGKCVTFHLNCDNSKLAELYRNCSVVVQPSLPSAGLGFDKSELLGLVALEGMSWSKPVVVTRVASLPEVSIDGVTGTIVNPHDPQALKNAVERFVADPVLGSRVGMLARNHAINHYSWENAALVGFALYQQIMDS